MFKGYNNRQQHGFPNLNFSGNISAYNFNGLDFWLDAAYGLNTQNNGANINSWIEKLRGVNFIQNIAANQPFLRSSDVNFNNLPVIDFSTSRFLVSSFGGLSFGNNTTLAIIAKYDSLGRVVYVLGKNLLGSLAGILLGGSDPGFTGIGLRNTVGTLWASNIENSNAHIIIISKTLIIVDGATVLNNSSNTIFPELELDTIAAGVSGNIATFLNGKIAEILRFNYEMTETQMIQLSNNINQKYALY